MAYRGPIAVIVLACLATSVGRAAAPQLEDVPAPRLADGLPAPAQWPLLRHDAQLRACAIISKNRPLAVYQRICRRIRASLDVRYTNDGDARYHVNDKWIEPQGDPTNEELTAHCQQLVREALQPIRGARPFDVVFYDHTAQRLTDVAFQQNVRAFLEAGGILAVCGNAYPPPGSPLAELWPAQATPQNSWMSGGAKRADGPELAGVPVDRLTGHTWIPLAKPAPGGRALATGEAGAMFARNVGSGTLLFVPTGPMSRAWNLQARLGRTVDHDEIWLRAWDQVLHERQAGAKATPAYGDLRYVANEPLGSTTNRFPEGKAPAEPRAAHGSAGASPSPTGNSRGAKFTARIVNRAAAGPLAASLHVTSPQGTVLYQSDVRVNVPAGSEQILDLSVPVAAAWGAGLYPVYLTLGDAGAKQQWHQALEFLPVTGTVQLSLVSAKPGYRLGENAEFTLTASSAEPWQGDVRLGIYDFRGRLLRADQRPLQLTDAATQLPFAWPMTDHGVRADTFWVVASAVRDGAEYAHAEAKFYKQEPWSPRHEYQWSTWAGIACGSPCAVPAGMRLMAHAGMNALGYPGQPELYYAAERWGWRYYNEGVGMNTFSPVIEYENDAEITTALSQEAERQLNSPDLRSATFVLGSVGEEAGYKTGWGAKYYWDTPVAPDKACRALQWYLNTKYGNLEKLNATWRTNYHGWDEVKLTREFSGPAPPLAADGWAHPQASPLGADVTGVSLAPYFDTEHFYAWYYDRIIAAAKGILRQRINPVTQTMASAPASWIFNSHECDVRLTGPSAWNESQWHSLDDGPEPAFSLVWGHFDWNVKTENLLWGYLLQRSGHNNYWVDVPLMFNNDMSHTRASLALRRWTSRLAGHERVLLDSRPAPSEVGLLPHNGISPNATPGNLDKSLRVALLQSGHGFAVAEPADLTRYKIVFAPARQSLSQSEAERLHAYVEQGGTLVFTARFGNQDEFGASQSVCPGQSLAERWGLTVTANTASIPQHGQDRSSSFPLDAVDASLQGFVASGRDVYREQVATSAKIGDKPAQEGETPAEPRPANSAAGASPSRTADNVTSHPWSTLASYADRTPAILTRTLGRGRLVYCNAIYQSHWYIQWVTPTGPERQGFYKLVEWLCRQAGATRTFQLDGDLDQVLHLAAKQFTDETGAIRYVVLRTSGEVPWTNARLSWRGPGAAVYDVLGEPRGPSGREIPLHLRPGDGKWLAVLPAPLKALRVHAEPQRLTLGQPLRVTTELLDDRGHPIPGKFPLELRIAAAGREVPGLSRSVSLASGNATIVETALSDPLGPWTLTVTDGITGLSGSTGIDAVADRVLPDPGFVSLGWPSEIAEPARVSATEFLDRLRRLSTLYQTDQSDPGWQIKQRLGAYYDFFPGTRHHLLRPLYDVDWTTLVNAWRAAISEGETFVLTGEDVNVDPATGLSIGPHGDGRQLAAVATLTHDATWRLGTRDGETLVATLGKGRLILCRESLDAAGYTNANAARWQQRWRTELAAGADALPALPAWDEAALRRWWLGEFSATAAPRTIAWFSGNQRELTLPLHPDKPLEAVFAFALPPQGKVKSLDFEILAEGAGTLVFDVGADDTRDAEWVVSHPQQPIRAASLMDWAAAVDRYLASRIPHGGPVRDDNRWRIVPVRVRGTAKLTLTLRQPSLTCQ